MRRYYVSWINEEGEEVREYFVDSLDAETFLQELQEEGIDAVVDVIWFRRSLLEV